MQLTCMRATCELDCELDSMRAGFDVVVPRQPDRVGACKIWSVSNSGPPPRTAVCGSNGSVVTPQILMDKLLVHAVVGP